MLVKHRPVRAKGRPAKTTDENGYNVTNNADAIERGNSRAYIEQRLSRDFPKIWKDYLNGKFRSARQAAIAAGFIKDTHDPLMRLKAYWNKATKKQRAEFLKWAAQG
jgi:hypothetical protein